MIVYFNVFCDSDLTNVTSQSRTNGYVRTSLGVPSQLQTKQNLIQFNFNRKLNLDIFLKPQTSISLKCLLDIFVFGGFGFI